MNTRRISGSVMPAAFAADGAKHHPRSVNHREHRQTRRIKDGKRDGQLTKGELDKLKADEAALRAEEKAYRESGGGLNRKERKDLQKDLNKTSREIYRAKHNRRRPPQPAPVPSTSQQ